MPFRKRKTKATSPSRDGRDAAAAVQAEVDRGEQIGRDVGKRRRPDCPHGAACRGRHCAAFHPGREAARQTTEAPRLTR